jgi:hypothetical protein
MTDILFVKNIPVPYRVGTLPYVAELAMKIVIHLQNVYCLQSPAVVGINQSLYL